MRDIPVYASVVHMLDAAARRAPAAEALVCGAQRLTYGAYVRCVAGFAHELRERIAPGERVALLVANSVEAAIATFAVQAAGAVFCPMNPAYTARELREMLTDCGARLAVCDAAAAATLVPIGAEIGVTVLQVGDGGRCLTAWVEDDRQALTGLLPDPSALGMIQYTGGTTGRSKGVMLTHGAIARNVSQREALLPTRPGDRLLCMMPLFHSFAMAMNLYQAAFCAGALVILPRYRPDWVVDVLVAERINVLPAGATVFIGLLGYQDFDQTDFSHLRVCYSGASALPAEILRRWTQVTGCTIYEGYGQTEAGPILTYNSPHFAVKPAKVGRVLPDTEVQIVDVETGSTVLPVGESGEIRARGPQLMQGYWNRPEETAATLRDGWLYTGDIGALDADGYLAIQDRKKDLVITGGYNVYPREVDEVLLTHEAVQEAAAFGVPDAYRGEVVHAHVVLRSGAIAVAEDLLVHCRANLAKYKVPAVIRVVDALPKTAAAKIDKKALRALAAAANSAKQGLMTAIAPRLFAPDLLTRIREQFHHVESCPVTGRRRVFFENGGGSLKLKSAIEVSARLAAIPDQDGRDNDASRWLVAQMNKGREDLRIFFGSDQGQVISGETGTMLIWRIVREIALSAPAGPFLSSTLEHPASYDAAGHWAERTGRQRISIPLDIRSGTVTPAAYAAAVTADTRCATIIHTSQLTGLHVDLPGVVQAIRAKAPDCFIVVDGIQNAPHGRVEVEAYGADAYVFSAYKTYSRLAIGFAWLAPRLVAIPHEKPHGKKDYVWELGSRDMAMYASHTAVMDYFAWLGGHFTQATDRRALVLAAADAMAAHEKALVQRLINALQQHRGVTLVGPPEVTDRQGIVSFGLKGFTAPELVRLFAARDIRVHARVDDEYSGHILADLGLKDCLRVSLCHYNSPGEIDEFMAALHAIAPG